MDWQFNEMQAVVRLLIATAAGGLLGLERTRKLRPAGLRTYTLICVGACMVMLVGIALYYILGESADPTRMAAQVVSGIGFIGAGTILTTRNKKVKGLTTAAGLWAAACLGLVIGAGMYLTALAGFIIVAAALCFAELFEDMLSEKIRHMQVHIILAGLHALPALHEYMQTADIRVEEVNLSDAAGGEIMMDCKMHLPPKADKESVMKGIRSLEGVFFAEK